MIHRISLAGLLLVVSLAVSCSTGGPSEPPPPPVQKPRIYIANDDHTDYIWVADEDTYRDAFLQMLDYYLDQADATAANPSDFQSRFNADGSLWLWTYQKNRSTVEFQRLIDRIRDGHITIPLQTLVLCYGAMPAEAVIRSMYYPGRIERAFSVPFELACAMEDQTLPYGLPSLWAGAGAKYSWKGVCNCGTTTITGLANRGREIYHAVGPDGRSVLMKWHSWTGYYASGGYAEARDPSAAVDFAASDATFRSRYPFTKVVGMFGKGGDDLQTLTNDLITTAQAKSSDAQRVIVSNEVDFFRDFESNAPSSSVPSFSGGFGNEWDVYSATMAEVTAGVKRAVEDLRSAEALATLVSFVDPTFMSARSEAAEEAFMNMGLYYEHCWTAESNAPVSWKRPDYQRRTASQIVNYVSSLKSDAAAALAGYIQNPGGNRFYVFNPLGWSRTDIADIPSNIAPPFRVVDVTTGNEVRSQLIAKNSQSFIRILAENVPSVGYRVYEIQGVPSQFTDYAATFSNGGATFENDRYRVTADGHGAISSMIDKLGGNRQLVQAGHTLNDIGSGAGTPVAENVGSVSATLFVNAGGAPYHSSRFTLYQTVDRIDIDDEVTSNFGDAVITYDFNFDLSGYTVRHEEVGAIATAKLKAQGGSYSDDLGRYDYLTMNHFVDLSDAVRGVTLSNWDSPFFKLGNSSGASLDVTTPEVKALVGGRVDANLGIPNQNGDSYFRNRYALRSHAGYDQADAMRMALEHQNPFVTAYLTTGAGGEYPSTNFSLISVADPHTILWALKPAEEGFSQGIIARVWNVDNSTYSLDLTFHLGSLLSAHRTTHIETNTTTVSILNSTLSDVLPGQWIQTYRIVTR
ncbi:MAG: glycoside hydrolase [Candidatus Aminicenantales bacterium]